jgi:hypothetical protein
MPDVLAVFADRAVRGEMPATRHVEDGHPRPLLRVSIGEADSCRTIHHFDGYMVMKNGELEALAGGDVRYGGLYDLVGISREYHADQILTRFAVVQRRRMEAVG